MRIRLLLACSLLAASAGAQSFNIDLGEPDAVPSPNYAAAGGDGLWIGLVAPHGSTTFNLLDVDGIATDVSVRQLGATQTLTVDDPTVLGEDALLLEDYLVTFSTPVESCLFFEHLEPGVYEVLIYAWMPLGPTIKGLTNIDQETGNPHLEVGGPWSGAHEELVTYSRHIVEVGPEGILNMHSGIAAEGNPALGAALNAVQIRPFAEIFADGFESGDTNNWSTVVP